MGVKKTGLGRGLKALINEADVLPGEAVLEIEVDKVRPNPYQPRRAFAPEALQELADSIREHGVIQPVVVRARGQEYELVSGERRLRAVQLLGLSTVPAIVRALSESEAMELALIENIQREDLSPVEEAQAYQALMDKLGLSQEQVAERVGKSRPYVANAVRLLRLPDVVLASVAAGRISAGHARTLLAIENEAQQIEMARRIENGEFTVRDLENAVRDANVNQPGGAVRKPRSKVPAELAAVQETLRRVLDTMVRVHGTPERGKIEIEYCSTQDLERIIEVLGGTPRFDISR